MTFHIPALAAFRQFIPVRLVQNHDTGKLDKLPLSRSGDVVDAHDPGHWLTLQEAQAVSQHVGFVLTEADPFWCLDIDGCARPDGSWSPLALELVNALPGCVVERSVSGNGLHIWGAWAAPQKHRSKNTPLKIELYSQRRFIVLGQYLGGQMTGYCAQIGAIIERLFPPNTGTAADIPDDGPSPEWRGPTDDDDLIRRACASNSARAALRGGVQFVDLWNGNVEALARAFPSQTDAFDRSGADLALANALAWWTGRDVARIERLMRRSALVREKWDSHATYLVEYTILKACQRTEVLQEQAPASVVASTPAASELGVMQPVAAVDFFDPDAPCDGGFDNPLTVTGPAARATLANVRAYLVARGVPIMRDTFTGKIVSRKIGTGEVFQLSTPRKITLRTNLERVGFKPVGRETMDDVLEVEAARNAYDSAQALLDTFTWDGVARISTFLPRYLRTADTPYTRAVSLYIWSALAGRVITPGVKADMVPILGGGQGAGKSTALKIMALSRTMFAELDLGKPEDDLARQMQGKVVCELGELRGLSAKDMRAVKAWVARDTDEWVPKFREESNQAPRRCILFGTTNEDAYLDDPTGLRRWLPLIVGDDIDLAGLAADVRQLWAEGAALYRLAGVQWSEAERLARGEHSAFEVRDEAEAVILNLLDQTPEPTTDEVAGVVFSMPARALRPADAWRLRGIMRRLGYSSTLRRVPGTNQREYRWTRRGGV